MSDFRDKVRDPDCELCPLYETAQHVCLMGSGPTRAKVMIVGEAPGAREDAEHEAFVGKSGQLLNKALKELAGLSRDEVHVTNAVKCRPPDNATPSAKQIKVCSNQYLDLEIENVLPEWVLTLGNVPMKATTGKSGITKHHGSVYHCRTANGTKYKTFPTLHPAAVMRNPGWMETFAADLERFGDLISGEATGPETRVFIVRSKQDLKLVRGILMNAPVISYDIETQTRPKGGSYEEASPYVRTNFQEWHDDDSMIASISFTWREGYSVVIPLDHQQATWRKPYDVLRYLKPALERDDCVYVAHNGKFDARWLRAKGIRIPQGFDTMLAAHVLEENRPKGLKALSRTELGADSYEIGDDLKFASLAPIKRLARYNGKDTDYTFRLREVLEDQLDAEPTSRRILEKLLIPASNAFVEIEQHGVWIDPDRWKARHDEAVERRETLYEYINRWVPKELRPINLNSPKQVAHVLFEELGLPIIAETKTGAPSTAESVLLRLQHEHKMPLAMIKYRKWAKYLSTYLLPWWYEHRDSKGYIRSNYKLGGTRTGRLSGEGGIQQVPRDPFIRSIIGAPPGWKFVQADYSQVELRIAAMISGDTNMINQYLRGDDIHMIRAMRMTGKPAEEVEKEERKKAKAVNFGYIYGMGAKKFVDYAYDSYGLKVSMEEATRDRDGFFRDYPGLVEWHQKSRRAANKFGRVSSPLGRIRHLPDITSEDKEVRAEAERQAINSPVQSMASDLMLFSLIGLHDSLPYDRARVVGTVHDSILFMIRDKHVDEYAGLIKYAMEDIESVEDHFGCVIDVPIVVDIEVGQHWGEGTEWHE